MKEENLLRRNRLAPVQTQCESRELFDNYGVLNLFVALLQNYNSVMMMSIVTSVSIIFLFGGNEEYSYDDVYLK